MAGASCLAGSAAALPGLFGQCTAAGGRCCLVFASAAFFTTLVAEHNFIGPGEWANTDLYGQARLACPGLLLVATGDVLAVLTGKPAFWPLQISGRRLSIGDDGGPLLASSA